MVALRIANRSPLFRPFRHQTKSLSRPKSIQINSNPIQTQPDFQQLRRRLSLPVLLDIQGGEKQKCQPHPPMGDLLDLLLGLLFAREISGRPLLLLDAFLPRV